MDSRRFILRNLTSLTKFEPTAPRKFYYVNTLTKNETITELIDLVKQKTEFVVETKYDKINGCPKLIQILFGHKFVLHTILVETLYLPEIDHCLHHQLKRLFSVILSQSNEIQSWDDIKSDLYHFLKCSLFTKHQVEKLQAVSIKEKFGRWFEEKCINMKVYGARSEEWSIEEAFAFLFQQYFDTSVSDCRDWNVGLFAYLHTNCEPHPNRHNQDVINLLNDNKRRLILRQYAIHECTAVRKIASVLQNSWTRKNAENYLIKYYGKFSW
ncbi:unnamed protein product [Adineta ricciae]|uniref:Uncharacterized protein n=1 Tax=Adineta ricciae TaxID=249248 RepID=A0A815P9P2_ADIRI|nr:unnamed protein product [Adineta ricciae]